MDCLIQYGSSDSENDEVKNVNSDNCQEKPQNVQEDVSFQVVRCQKQEKQELATKINSNIFQDVPTSNASLLETPENKEAELTMNCQSWAGPSSETKKNFFNLSSDSESDPEYDADADRSSLVSDENKLSGTSSSTKNITTAAFGSLAIPGSKYWDDFNPTEIKTRPTVTDQNPLLSQDFKRQRQKQKGKDYPQPQTKYKKSGNLDLPKPAVARKKIFYVHHKIGPHLVSSPPHSRPPKKEVIKVDAHGAGINRLKWCLKKEYSHLIASASSDSTVKIWNLFSSECPREALQTIKSHSKGVRDIAWSNSGIDILSCGYDRNAFITDIEKNVCRHFPHRDYVTCLGVHPVEPHLFLSGTKNAILCWDLRQLSLEPVKEFRYKDDIGQVQDVLFINNGNEVVSTSDIVTRDSADRNVMVWDFRTNVVLSNQVYQERYTCIRLLAHPEDASFMVQSNGNYLASFSTVRPYKMNKCKRFEGHTVLGYNIGCDKSPDGKIIISGSSDGKLTCYDYYTTKVMKKINTGFSVCLDVAYHPVLSNTVACSSWDGQMSLWQ